MRRARDMALVLVLAAATLAPGCQNSGGKVLGPSGVSRESLGSTCGVRCGTIDDCRKIKPKRDANGVLAEFPFVWIDCRDGVCVDVECATDDDCKEHLFSDRQGRPCVNNQCGPPCGSEYCDRLRDECVDGSCVRKPDADRPDPACEGGDCLCFSDADCPIWTECRGGNICGQRQYYNWSTASGKPCDADERCGRLYFQQAMMEKGLNPGLMTRWGICSEICDDGDTGYLPGCGPGFSCVAVSGLLDLEKLNDTMNASRSARTTCIPDACAACTSSVKECADDAGCPDGESCATTWGGCPGVCLKSACAGCAPWFKGARACSDPDIDIPINVRRPD